MLATASTKVVTFSSSYVMAEADDTIVELVTCQSFADVTSITAFTAIT